MNDAASIHGAAAGDGVWGSPVPAGPTYPGQAWLSDEDVLALLDGLGVAGTHDPEDQQEAVAAAEGEARHTYDDRSTASQGRSAGQLCGDDDRSIADDDRPIADDE